MWLITSFLGQTESFRASGFESETGAQETPGFGAVRKGPPDKSESTSLGCHLLPWPFPNAF